MATSQSDEETVAEPRTTSQDAAGPQLDETSAYAVEEIAGLDDLADTLLSMTSREECRRFLRDLCTLGELEALAHRWQIARLVDEGRPYLEIAERVRTSTATVTRVAHWVHHGAAGYRIALDRAAGRAAGR
jgi:TrpR-related protein YerC/YecD